MYEFIGGEGIWETDAYAITSLMISFSSSSAQTLAAASAGTTCNRATGEEMECIQQTRNRAVGFPSPGGAEFMVKTFSVSIASINCEPEILSLCVSRRSDHDISHISLVTFYIFTRYLRTEWLSTDYRKIHKQPKIKSANGFGALVALKYSCDHRRIM